MHPRQQQRFKGGAVENNDHLTLKTSTISGNTASQGAGIYNGGSGSRDLNVVNSTLVGDIDNSGTLNLISTILKSAVTIVNHGGADLSKGWNMSSDNGGGFFDGTADQINTDPQLDPAGLQDNGGPTQTIALIAGSPALDKGRQFDGTTDQRGQPRPFDNPSIPNAVGGDGTDMAPTRPTLTRYKGR